MTHSDAPLVQTEHLRGETITLHRERCLNARYRAVDCRLCADACPAEGAIVVIDAKPGLDNEACLSCGLCLHICPTGAFTLPDGVSSRVVKTAAALPPGPVDLVCPQHPDPDSGLAPHGIQTKRCLAALSPATLLELSTQGHEVWLDDTPCSACPLGTTHPALEQTVAEANSWAGLLEDASSISLRTEQAEAPEATQRPVFEADRLPISRRDLFGSVKQLGQETAESEAQLEMIKTGKAVPVSERLPQAVPRQRAKILSILDKKSLITNNQLLPTDSRPSLPIADIKIDPSRCSACGLCARFCPTGALRFLSDGEEFGLTFRPSLCLGQDCNICELACPEQAVVSQPASISADLLSKKPLIIGELAACQRCRLPIASGPNLPTTCFACRSKNTQIGLF